MIVDAEAFGLFQESIVASRDVLFKEIAKQTQTFLPSLLHPRLMAVDKACALCPESFQEQDWRTLVEKVTRLT